MTFVLLVRWQGDVGNHTEWPAVTGPFATEAAAMVELAALFAAGEVDPSTHDFSITSPCPPSTHQEAPAA